MSEPGTKALREEVARLRGALAYIAEADWQESNVGPRQIAAQALRVDVDNRQQAVDAMAVAIERNQGYLYDTQARLALDALIELGWTPNASKGHLR